MGYVPVHVEIEVGLEKKECKVMSFLEEQNIDQFTVIDVRESSKGTISHMVNISQTQLELIVGDMPFEIVNEGKEEASVWLESEGCDVCKTIIECGSFLVSGGCLGQDQVLYRFISPHQEAFQEVLSKLDEKGHTPIVRKVEKHRSEGDILTSKQRLVLWHALKAGFFEYPRKINTIELSKRLDMVPSTLSEITRRGFRRLLESYFHAED
jgi:predicted DNA binding protein